MNYKGCDILEIPRLKCPVVEECIERHNRFKNQCTCDTCNIDYNESNGNSRIVCGHCPYEMIEKLEGIFTKLYGKEWWNKSIVASNI